MSFELRAMTATLIVPCHGEIRFLPKVAQAAAFFKGWISKWTNRIAAGITGINQSMIRAMFVEGGAMAPPYAG